MGSFEKIDYLLRPSKQVERKLFVEALQRLSKAGYYLHDYPYIGFGSVFYADFIMFHKYLSISDMTCLEHQDVQNRMEFNKPYPFIKLRMQAANDFVHSIPRDKPQFVWLDYDYNLSMAVLEDIDGFVTALAPGSIFVVSVSANSRSLETFVPIAIRKTITKEKDMTARVALEMTSVFAQFLKPGMRIIESDITRRGLPELFSRLMLERISQSLNPRSGDLRFHTLFKYVYADNAVMFTLGGIIDELDAEHRLKSSGIRKLDYVVKNADEPSIPISVPPLTLREKQWLERYRMPKGRRRRLAFEMDDEMVENFIRFYKYYPTYYETFI